jgi:hypothetical protein
MTAPRDGACSVLLRDGRILVTGGTGSSGTLASSEIFGTDGSFSPAATLANGRSNHTCSLLPDGTVLVTGGRNDSGPLNSTEIYDPLGNAWSPVAGMAEARSGHTATTLEDGRVILAGGEGVNGPIGSIEVFSPSTRSFKTVPVALSSARKNHAAALLTDGRVLIAGGFNGDAILSTSDIVDAEKGAVSPGPQLSVPRSGLTATTLLDGKILFAGGNNGSVDLASADVYDPAAATLAPTGNLVTPRSGHQAFLLPNNNEVLLIGGSSSAAAISAELYVPWAGTFQPTGYLAAPRVAATGSPMKADGLSLLAGGSGSAAAELYGFATVKTDKDDYAPGTMVTITGSGWRPGEPVTLSLLESPNYDTHPLETAVADASGNFVNTQFSPDDHDLNIRFYLTATGSASQAQTTFTDASPDDTSMTVTCSPGTVSAGSSTTCAARVSNITAGAPKGSPQGSVKFSISTTGMGGTFTPSSATCTLAQISTTDSSCSVTFTPSGPFNGTGTIKGQYNASPNDWKNNNATADVVVNGQATTTTTVQSSASGGSTYGQSVTFTSTVTSTSGTPTGGVTFYDGGSCTAPGSTLASASLNSGSASFSTAALTAGAHTILACYNPTGIYIASSGTATQQVNPAAPIVTVTGGTFTYDGSAHTASAVAKVGITTISGTFAFSYSPGGSTAPVNAGTYTVTATFTSTDQNYGNATGTGTITISQADATIKVDGYTGVYDGNPHGATGTATGAKGESLSGLLHLGNSFTNVPGGTATWSFDGDNNYKSATGSATITISQADATIKVDGYTGVYDGNPHGATGTAKGVKGEDFTTLLHLGNTFTNAPGGTANWTFDGNIDYKSASGTAAIVIKQATPVITWANPADIMLGTALSTTQLNAIASVPGSFAYSPAAGTVLSAGVQTLSVTFTPADATNFTTVTKAITIVVVPYKVYALYDPTKAVKSGAAYPIKLYVYNASGANVSSPGLVLNATRVTQTSGYSGQVEDAGNANPDFNFRYDATLGSSGGYIFNLKTNGLASGTYTLTFTVAGASDPFYSAAFGVK